MLRCNETILSVPNEDMCYVQFIVTSVVKFEFYMCSLLAYCKSVAGTIEKCAT